MTQTSVPRAALYLRISKDQTGNRLGVDRQRTECLQLMQARGVQLVREYMDNDTGASRYSKRLRAAYQQMLTDAKSGDFDTIVSWDLDRLLRRPREGEDLIDLNTEHAVNLLTVSESVDLSTPNGQMYLRIKTSVAANESDQKSSRIKAKNRQVLAEGMPIRGRRKFGWEPDGITLLRSESDAIREATLAVANGSSLRSIMKAWNDADIKTGADKRWKTTNQLREVLQRERNFGRLVSKGVVQEKSLIEPIVTEAEFNACAGVLAEKTSTAGREIASWLSGAMECAECGSPMYSHHAHYVCSRQAEGAEKVAKHTAIGKHIAEARITNEIVSAFLLGPAATVPEATRVNLGKLTTDRQEVQAQRARIVELVKTGLVTLPQVTGELQGLNDQEEALTNAMVRLSAESASSNMYLATREAMFTEGQPVNTNNAVEARKMLRQRFESLSIEQRRDLARRHVHVVVRRGRDANRMVVTHLIATSLNGDDEPDMYIPGE